MASTVIHEDLIKRLRRIEGQVQGIQRMLADDRDCREVLNQLASVRAATQSVSVLLMKRYALTCLHDPDNAQSPEDTLSAMVEWFARLAE